MRETDWIYRGGYSALCLYVAEGALAGAAMATDAFRTPGPASLVEREPTGAGTLRDVAGGWRVAVEVFDGAALAWLSAVREAGAEVRALLVARGMGRHLRWDEPVPVLVDTLHGGLSGGTLLLECRAGDAAVYERPDLLMPATFADGGGWTAENAGAGSGWAAADDPLTGLPGEAYALHADAGETASLHATATVPAVGAVGNGALALCFVARLGGVGAVLATGATIEVTVSALTYANRALSHAAVLSGGKWLERSAEPVPFADGAEQDEDVRITYPEGAWAARVAVEVTAAAGAASGPLTVSSPSLLTRAPDGATLTPGAARAGVAGVKMAPDGRTLHVYDPASVTGSTPTRHTIVIPAGAVVKGAEPLILGD